MAATELLLGSTIPKEGDVLLGKYRVEKLLGAGGMGVVVAAQHVQLDEFVAIKFLLPEALENQEAVARFTREARAAVKIKSEHVARVTDVGTLPEGTPYMVMEYLQGHDLSAELQTKGQLNIESAVLYVAQACEAIAEAHTLGIVHRDLKPANLFLTKRPDGSPSIKVLDFGISKVTQKDGSMAGANMTRTTAIMGSPLYMSPEQMASTRNVDLRTDIYALGVILHELMTGGPVFNADTMPQLCAMILQEPPPPLRNLRPEAPEQLEQLILRCLLKDPKQRFADVAELVWALVPFGPPEVRGSAERITRLITASPMGTTGDRTSQLPRLAQMATSSTSATNANWADTKPTEKKSRAALFLGIGALVVLGAGGTGAMLWHRAAVRAAASLDAAAAAQAKQAAEAKKKSDALAREAEEARKKADDLARQVEDERKAATADHAKLDELTKEAQAQEADAANKAEQAKKAGVQVAPARKPAAAATAAAAPPPAAPASKPAAKPAAPSADDLFSDRK